jgi:hypothetical protein
MWFPHVAFAVDKYYYYYMACGGCDSCNNLFRIIIQVIVLFATTSYISHGDSGNIWRFVFSANARFVFLANAANYLALLKTKICESNKLKLIQTESSSLFLQ